MVPSTLMDTTTEISTSTHRQFTDIDLFITAVPTNYTIKKKTKKKQTIFCQKYKHRSEYLFTFKSWLKGI